MRHSTTAGNAQAMSTSTIASATRNIVTAISRSFSWLIASAKCLCVVANEDDPFKEKLRVFAKMSLLSWLVDT